MLTRHDTKIKQNDNNRITAVSCLVDGIYENEDLLFFLVIRRQFVIKCRNDVASLEFGMSGIVAYDQKTHAGK